MKEAVDGGDQIEAYDCGDAAADWLKRNVFAEVSGEYRLMYYGSVELASRRTINRLMKCTDRTDMVG